MLAAASRACKPQLRVVGLAVEGWVLLQLAGFGTVGIDMIHGQAFTQELWQAGDGCAPRAAPAAARFQRGILRLATVITAASVAHVYHVLQNPSTMALTGIKH